MHAERCPVCNGSGLVQQGFYGQVSVTWSSGIAFETCRSCDGKGYILIPDDIYTYEVPQTTDGKI